jgi:hypothetical protein
VALPDASTLPIELRCGGTLHGVLKMHNGEVCLEKKCHHIKCTKGKAGSHFHYFSLQTGDLVDTVIYRDIGRKFG